MRIRSCEDEKMFYRPPLLEEPCAQTLSGKTISIWFAEYWLQSIHDAQGPRGLHFRNHPSDQGRPKKRNIFLSSAFGHVFHAHAQERHIG